MSGKKRYFCSHFWGLGILVSLVLSVINLCRSLLLFLILRNAINACVLFFSIAVSIGVFSL